MPRPAAARLIPSAIPAAAAAALAVALATAAAPAAAAPDCVRIAADAEGRFGIPGGILQAIALVESGIGGVAWPWTLNVSGRPVYLASAADAARAIDDAVREVGDDMAVGCMQVHLRWHGAAFPDLSRLVDPVTNVRYAAAFIVSLQRTHGSWVEAVRRYHASDERAQRTYLCRVLKRRIELGHQDATPATVELCRGVNP